MDYSRMEEKINFLSILTLAIAYPVGYYFHLYFESFPINDSLVVRFGFSLYCILIYVFYNIKKLKKYLNFFTNLLHILTLLYANFLCYKNYLSTTYTVGLSVIIGNIIFTNQSLKFMKLYLSLTIVTSFLVSLNTENSIIHPWVFFISMSMVSVFAYYAHRLELRLIWKLDQERKKANRAMQDKAMFLAKMSHEIRNPLTAILAVIELLENEKNENTQKEYLSIVKSSSELLLEIINDTLDISKLEAGKMDLNPDVCDPYEIAHTCYELYKPRARQKDLEFEFRAIGPRASYLADSVRIKQILVNLIGNAVKFTNHGKVIIELETKIDNNLLHSIFKIFDTGLGIPPNQKDKLFQQYYQIQSDERKHIKGTGLGLYISKLLCELMGGKLYFESPPPKEFAQKGTVFFLELCFPLVEIVNTNMKNPNQELLSLQKVLIIDDDEVNLFVLSKYMEFFQISFQAENNPLQALEKARQEKFTIILVDIEMPKMNGLEFINQLQSQEGPSKNAKFIIISGHDQSRINLLPNKTKFLTKPIKKDVLYETLLELSNAS